MLHKYIVASATVALASLGQVNAGACPSQTAPAAKIAGEACGCATEGGTDGVVGGYCISGTPLAKCADGVLTEECACPSVGDEVATNVGYASGKVCTPSGTTTDGGTFGAPADCTSTNTPYAGCEVCTAAVKTACAADNKEDCTSGDATCGACKADFMPGANAAAACVADACTAAVKTACAADNKEDCTSGDATCGACKTGFYDNNGTCATDACNTAAKAACAAANKENCSPGATDTCGACKTGFVVGATAADACVSPSTTTAGPHDGHDHSPAPAGVDAASTMSPASLVTVATMLIAFMMH